MTSQVFDRALYGGDTPAPVTALLEQAMQCYADTDRAEGLLWQARLAAPQALSVFFSLYKFYFYKHQLEKAELTVRQALQVAARQGGFDSDWRRLDRDSTEWTVNNLPAHFFLFSLKALAFIRLRRGEIAECREILEKLAVIDPADQVGACVIRAYAEGAVG
jgi:tetratricopeptide (TPR) repeat protein